MAVSLNRGAFFVDQDNDDFITSLKVLSGAFSRGGDKQNSSTTVPNRSDSSEDHRHKKAIPKVYPNEIKIKDFCYNPTHAHTPLHV